MFCDRNVEKFQRVSLLARASSNQEQNLHTQIRAVAQDRDYHRIFMEKVMLRDDTRHFPMKRVVRSRID